MYINAAADSVMLQLHGTRSNICMYINAAADSVMLQLHGTRSNICMYINAAADSVMLQLLLRWDFHKIIFKLKNK